jgi:ubiquinone/menaquinone biosynthesis C-methylase UbiE
MNERRSDSISAQQQAIRQEYRQQAPRWGKLEIGEHLLWVVDQLPLSPQSEVVDVAAGTGLFGRALAPRVARVTAVDITPEMIEQGRQRAQQDGIANMVWQQGEAEALPTAALTSRSPATRSTISSIRRRC